MTQYLLVGVLTLALALWRHHHGAEITRSFYAKSDFTKFALQAIEFFLMLVVMVLLVVLTAQLFEWAVDIF
jgi:hypothetical protein